MKLTGRISQRPRVVLVTLVLVCVAVVAGVLVASGGDEGEAERQLFLIGFHESLDFALVEEYGGEIWIPYAFVSAVNAWMTPEAAEALAEHEAVKCVDQRQLFFIRFEESVDMSLVEEYGGEVYGQSKIFPCVSAFMTAKMAEALAKEPAVRYVEPDWPVYPAEDQGI